ncbi:hypothetical protein LTR24_008468 [Lithohypha guttulata]|uniref:Uncharacterized protein n=1 Tax=Lithohypha guttulata TaxID=1690604 RepID=A0ABR0K017_9EURO|nr:hypothetical protein LTR24_008468 [Lithohypha guttulata]
MANDQYYDKVAGDDSEDPVVGGADSSRVMRAPPTQSKKRSLLTTLAFGAIAAVVFIFAVALVSSAVVSYRLPTATDAAISKQASTVTSSAQAVTTTGASTSKVGTDNAIEKVYDSSTHQDLRNCGGTPDEARAAGCVFDVMMQLWTPPECMDAPLSERFLEKGNWTWYADGGAQRAYTDEEIRKGDHDVVYVAQSYHRHHCIFAWERLVRAMRNQAPLIEELISYDHVMHCRHKTLTLPEEGAEEVRGVVAPTGYDVWIKNLPFNKMSSSD